MIPSPLLIRLAAHARESTAVIGPDGARTSYGALAGRSTAAAAALAASGVRPGDAVAFLIDPGASYVETLLAIWRARAVAVPLSPLHAAPELSYVIENAAPAALVASETLAPRLATAVPPAARAARLIAEALVASPAAAGEQASPQAADDALMLYTSGTTGRPKGVRLTHAALAATVTSLEHAWRWRRDDRLLHVLPLHHTHGLVVALLGALW